MKKILLFLFLVVSIRAATITHIGTNPFTGFTFFRTSTVGVADVGANGGAGYPLNVGVSTTAPSDLNSSMWVTITFNVYGPDNVFINGGHININTDAQTTSTGVVYLNVPSVLSGTYIVFTGSHSSDQVTLPVSAGSPSGTVKTQTCSVVQNSRQSIKGVAVTGQASGSQGGAYAGSITSGSGSITVDPVTGAFSVVSDSAGVVGFEIHINGVADVATASLSSNGSTTFFDGNSVKINIPANNTDFPVIYYFKQDGVILQSYAQSPGASAYVQNINLGSNTDPVTVSSAVEGIKAAGPVLVVDSTSTALPSGDRVTVTPTFTPLPSSLTPSGTPLQNPNNNIINPNSVWSSGGNATGDGLTNAVYREGVEKLIAAKVFGNSTSNSTSSNSTSTFPKTITKSLTINHGMASMTSSSSETIDADGNSVKSVNISDINSDTDGSKGQESGQALAAQLPSVSHVAGVVVATDTPNFTVAMPSAFGGASYDLNPYRSDRLGPAIDWFRIAMAWVCIVVYGIWLSKEVSEWMKGASVLPQAKGNTVAGTGGQLTAAAAAVVMTVVVSVFVVALVSWLAGDIVTFSLAISKASLNPTDGMPRAVAWMLDRTFPVATMITCLVARLTFNVYAAKLFAVCMTVIRYIVP